MKMKKLIYLLLLTPIIFSTSCSKSGVTPEVDSNIEETIVGKTWKLLNTEAGWFRLNDNNTYLTKDYLCDSLEQFGTWEIDGSVLIMTYIIGPLEYIVRNNIIDYNDSLVKVQADTSATLDINILFEIVIVDVVRGCVDSTASNFNADAECPLECIFEGCMDNTALNYNPNSTTDDGSCCYVAGCMDETADNYDPNACIDDSSCTYTYGCIDVNAVNYNPNAVFDDGSCCYVAGCMDNSAVNYDPNACQDDSSCCYVAGCMDNSAVNYNPNACQDNGTCCYVAGCMDNSAVNYNPNACQDDGSCCYVAGCMDNTALNFNASACFDDGSCLGIGATYQGGIIFYLDGNGGGLIAAPSDQVAFPNGAEWGCSGTLITGADGTAIGTGQQNTIDIEAECSTSGTAADICANLILNGYSDWFLPSEDELDLMLYHRVLIGGFSYNTYWSSTESNINAAVAYEANWSGITTYQKSQQQTVRAIRSF